jgi:hypothetical protein
VDEVTAERHIESISAAPAVRARRHTEVPEPPEGSGLALVYHDILQFMRYPNPQIAMGVTLHNLGTLIGWSYHFERTTCSAVRHILAPPGSGKSVSTSYFSQVIGRGVSAKHLSFLDFYAANGYTTTELHQSLIDFPTRSQIVNESGEKESSKLGNMHGIRAFELEVVALDVNAFYQPPEKTGAPLGGMYGPILNVLKESVQESQISAWRAELAESSGRLARAEVFFCPYRNDQLPKNRKHGEVGDKALELLIGIGDNTINTNRGKCLSPMTKDHYKEVSYSDEVYAYMDALEDKYSCNYEEAMDQTLNGRMYEKVKRTALIMAVADDYLNPTVTLEHMKYAETLERSLNETLKWHMESGSLSGPINECVSFIKNKIQEFGSTSVDRTRAVDINARLVGKSWLSAHLPDTKSYVKAALQGPPCFNQRDRLYREIISRLVDEDYITIVEPARSKPGGRKAEEHYKLSHIKESH